MDFKLTVNGHFLEYFDSEHLYLVDGVIVPSITQIIKSDNPSRLDGIPAKTLAAAAAAGTQVHNAIEQYCVNGTESDLPEVANFKFLRRHFNFQVEGNEIPVILKKDGKPVAAGRLDLVLSRDGKIGGADIKRVSTVDRSYCGLQLNLYRIAYQQCYGKLWEFLAVLQLKEQTRRFIDIPIDENRAWDVVEQFLGNKND